MATVHELIADYGMIINLGKGLFNINGNDVLIFGTCD